ncbi:MAG TPA: hypothetical protein VFU05_04305, partial [Cyclobacteriaceae bacterium]|nr:hypothetical protein [Cyclobacteriaceae bacterium]
MTKRYLIVLLLILSAITTQAQWTALSGPSGGDMKDIEVDGSNKLYTIVAEKIFTSTNEGVSWTQLVPTTPATLQVYDLLVDGTSLYVITYNSFYRSDDGGVNWTKLNSASASGQFYGVEGLIKVTTNTFAIFGWNGVYVSSDGGVNWVRISSNSTSNVVANAAGDLFMADQVVGVKKHAFAAGVWAASNVSVVHSKANEYWIRLGYKAPATIFLTVSDNIYKSTDGFATAPTSVKTAVITDSNFGWTRWTVAPDGKIYFGNHNYGALYVTANDGTSWTSLVWPAGDHGNPPTAKIIFTTATKGFAATAGDGVFKTLDGGATWTIANSGINYFLGEQVEIASNGRILVSEGYSHGYWYSDNAGVVWTFKNIGNQFNRKILKLPFGTPNTLLRYQAGYYSYSTNNGDAWTTTTSYLEDVTYNTAAPSGTTVYGVNGNVLYSSADGISWTPITITGLPTNFNYTSIAEDEGGLLYVRIYNSDVNPSKTEIYKITLANAVTGSAVKLTIPVNADEDQNNYYFVNLFVNNNKVYYATRLNIYYSSNQGGTWGTISFSHSMAFGLVDGARKGICASSSGTLYVTQDDGQSWASFTIPTSGTYSYINDIAVDGAGDFYAATYNSPALKNTASLLVDPATLPPYINFGWQPANGPYGGGVREVYIDDSGTNTYALRDGYFYKANATFNWQKISDPNSGWAADFIIDRASNPDKIYALYYSELRTSIDAGATWSIVANSENITGREQLVRSANGNLVMSTNNGGNFSIYISANGGTTFGSAKKTVSNAYLYNILTSTSNAILIRYYDNGTSSFKLIRSIDGGTTWPDVTIPIPTNNICGVSADENGNFYLVGNNDLYKSADNGATWNSIKGDYPSNAFGSCSRIFASGTNLYTFGTNGSGGSTTYGFYKSTNAGTNWTYTGAVATQYLNVNDVTWQGTRMVVA